MKSYIRYKTPIDIEYHHADGCEKIYSGICLKANKEVFILVNFDETLGEFNGISIFRDEFVKKYREWDTDDLAEILNPNFEDFSGNLNLDAFNSFISCLEELRKKELIAFFTSESSTSYYVGKIESISSDQISVSLISEDAEWLEIQKFSIDALDYIGFDTHYEKNLVKAVCAKK